MYATNYFEQIILNVMRGTDAAAPSDVYVGLFLSDPTDTGVAGTEVNYSSYERQRITFTAPTDMEYGIGIANESNITFPISPNAAGTITHIGVFDAASSGNMLIYGQLDEPQDIESQEAPVIVAGEAKWWLSGDMSVYFKTKILNLLRGSGITGVTPYLALYTGDPDGGGTELSGNNYGRLQLTFGAPTQQQTGEAKITTTASVATNRASTVWGTWGYTAIMDAASGGHCMFGKAKTPAKVMRVGLLATCAAGDLSLAVD